MCDCVGSGGGIVWMGIFIFIMVIEKFGESSNAFKVIIETVTTVTTSISIATTMTINIAIISWTNSEGH